MQSGQRRLRRLCSYASSAAVDCWTRWVLIRGKSCSRMRRRISVGRADMLDEPRMMQSIVRICGERWTRQACIRVDLEVVYGVCMMMDGGVSGRRGGNISTVLRTARTYTAVDRRLGRRGITVSKVQT